MIANNQHQILTFLLPYLKQPQNLTLSLQRNALSGLLGSRGFVHRDLAARNVLLGEGRTVKIADFGLLRRTYGERYEVSQMKKLPIKWSAPEALFYGRCTSKSDV